MTSRTHFAWRSRTHYAAAHLAISVARSGDIFDAGCESRRTLGNWPRNVIFWLAILSLIDRYKEFVQLSHEMIWRIIRLYTSDDVMVGNVDRANWGAKQYSVDRGKLQRLFSLRSLRSLWCFEFILLLAVIRVQNLRSKSLLVFDLFEWLKAFKVDRKLWSLRYRP